MRKLTLYTKPNCPLCDHTRHYLNQLLPEFGGAAVWQVEDVNIIADPALYRQYRYVIPVVDVEGIGPLPAPASLDPAMLHRLLSATPADENALAAEAAVILQSEQLEAETNSLHNALSSSRPALTVEQEQRHELYQELAQAVDAPLQALAATVQAHEAHIAAPLTVAPETITTQPTPEPEPYIPKPLVYAPPAYSATSMDRGPLGFLDEFAAGFSKRWLATFNWIVGVFVVLPWLAPIFARLNLWPVANVIYFVYQFFCHELPERSADLFGYQVAQCVRCNALYGMFFLTGLLYGFARNHPKGRLSFLLKPLAWQLFVLSLLPIAVDGLTHMFGLRESNAWFDTLTGGAFGSFSVGDAAGTLNWWLRVISGALFGFCSVWFLFPRISKAIAKSDNPRLQATFLPQQPEYSGINV